MSGIVSFCKALRAFKALPRTLKGLASFFKVLMKSPFRDYSSLQALPKSLYKGPAGLAAVNVFKTLLRIMKAINLLIPTL